MSSFWNVLDSLSSFLHQPLLESTALVVDGHLILEALLVVVIVILMTQKSYKPDKRQLTEKEVDQLVQEWTPEPLHGELPETVLNRDPPVLETAAKPWTVVNGESVLNLTSLNFLDLIGNPRVNAACTEAIVKYGVGSCGPRGFYGTIDVHLDLEERLARYVGTEDCILYSYGLATAASAIPAFCKRGDLIIADEGVGWAIRNGISLSRSAVRFFGHNDVAHLRSILEGVAREDRRNKRKPGYRRFIVVEAVYLASGELAPLDEIMRLKEEFKYRLIVEESLSLGVLGPRGRGITDLFGINPTGVDIIISTMGTTLASAGGFCCGNRKVADHQRLGGLGYCFSASLPPYLASGALAAIEEMEAHPELREKLQENIRAFREEMARSALLRVQGHELSPVQYVFLQPGALSQHRQQLGEAHKAGRTGLLQSEEDILHLIVDQLLVSEKVLVCVPERSILDASPLPLGIRVAVSAGHTCQDMVSAATKLTRVAAQILMPRLGEDAAAAAAALLPNGSLEH